MNASDKKLIGQTVTLSYTQYPEAGVVTDVEYPWGENDEPEYTVRMWDGRICYATASQIEQ